MQKIELRKRISRRVFDGHPHIFMNEIADTVGMMASVIPGEIVEVFAGSGEYIGTGYCNPNSQIPVRILTRNRKQEINDDFFEKMIQAAWDYRKQIGYTENCRLIFGEADYLPQCIIDKFNDYFVIQTLALGMDKWLDSIVKALNKIFSPKGIYQRNDVPVRELEGMVQIKDFLSEPFDTKIIINENGLKFYVDIENGQKTGYFLDQQDNRSFIQKIVKDKDVLGAFCYTGTFELHAAHYGAKSVLGLDISKTAVECCNENAKLNGLDNICKFETVNAFDQLKTWAKEGKRKWDVVMLDPPSFTKSRATLNNALVGYKEINLRGMKLVKPGGFLVTSSCTSLVRPEVFLETIDKAARDARRIIRQVHYATQSPDHPVFWHIDNTQYLKFLVVQVL